MGSYSVSHPDLLWVFLCILLYHQPATCMPQFIFSCSCQKLYTYVSFHFKCKWVYYILYIMFTAFPSSSGVCRSTNWQGMGVPAFCSQTTVKDLNAQDRMSASMTPCLVRCCMDTTTKPSKSTWDKYSK